MLNLKNTLDGYLKNVEVIGNTVQNTNNLADIRSVGDKVEGQELYKIDIVSCGKNLYNPNKVIIGNITENGDFQSVNNQILSDFIQVKSNNYYIHSLQSSDYVVNGFIGYDSNKNFVRFLRTSVDIIDENIKFVRVRFRKNNSNPITIDDVYIAKPQLEEGRIITAYEPYQGQKLEILSPVQLEKVGDVADRIICKDGVWGVEKNIVEKTITGTENWVINHVMTNCIGFCCVMNLCKGGIIPITDTLKQNSTYLVDEKGVFTAKEDNKIYVTLPKNELGNLNEIGCKNWFKEHPTKYMYVTTQPQFIQLPHDQQVKLRTFAGQTNIAFLTEIPGQIKAQVPKSLGATVNTHTEQIKDLHNSLDRVKKLEETTVSTVETESNFTTVDATSNGYFEGVKLEGKTLNNIVRGTSWIKYGSNNTVTLKGNITRLERTVAGGVCYMALPIKSLFKPNTEYTIIFPTYEFVSSNAPSVTLYNRDYSTNLSYGTRLSNMIKITTYSELPNSNNIELLVYIGANVGDYIEIPLGVIVLEGDHTNNPPEYFEGLLSVGQDVEEVSVESVSSGNLIDLSRVVVGKYIANNNKDVEHGTSFYCDKYVKVYPGVKYQLIASDNSNQRCRVSCYDKTSNYISTTEYATNTPIYFDSTVDTIRLSFFDRLHLKDMLYFGTNSNYIGQGINHNKKPLLYYNPTTETWEKPILREWDTIEKHSDGKYYYHKRSKEVVLNGSEDWSEYNTLNHANTFGARLPFKDVENVIGANCIVDTITKQPSTQVSVLDEEGLYLRGDSKLCYIKVLRSKLSTQDIAGFKAWLKDNPTTVVYKLAQEEVYECTNIDLMTYSGETNYIINSGAISPKSLLKVHNNISNVVKILQEKVSLLENTFIAGLRSVLSGDMYSLATILYPEDFVQNDNTEQDIIVIPE